MQITMRFATRSLLCAASGMLLAAVSACGNSSTPEGFTGIGGNDGAGLPNGPGGVDVSAGIYYGSIKGTGAFASSVPFYGLIDAYGNARFVEETNTLFGTYVVVSPAQIATSSDDTISVDYTAFSTTPTTGIMAATTVPLQSLSGSLTDSSSTVSNFTLTYEATEWETSSSLTIVAGSYTGSYKVGSTTYDPSLTIDGTTGQITGTDTGSGNSSCVYSGSVFVPDTNNNGYEISLTNTCASATFTFQGVAAYLAKSGFTAATLRTILSNDTNGIVLTLQQSSS